MTASWRYGGKTCQTPPNPTIAQVFGQEGLGKHDERNEQGHEELNMGMKLHFHVAKENTFSYQYM